MFLSPRYVQPHSICLCFFPLFQFIWLFQAPPVTRTRRSLVAPSSSSSPLVTSPSFQFHSSLSSLLLCSFQPSSVHLASLPLVLDSSPSSIQFFFSLFCPPLHPSSISSSLLVLQLQRNKIN